MQEKLLKAYLDEVPAFLEPFLSAKEMTRLKGVGMNCGVEYTSLPFFFALPKSDRFNHSLGVALLSYRYSQDKKAALAGLFHDIASPCFAHTIDFLKGDHAKQEKTEEGTFATIRDSQEIRAGLAKEGIALEEVTDYSLYP
ncbi:MAG: HD domain-containing protein, partial [Bacilli bacterium]|nr:HD domain-containing protein [Bacilli bacterium]